MKLPSYKDYQFSGDERFKLSNYPTSAHVPEEFEEQLVKKTAKNIKKIGRLQDKFYADGREGIVLLIQAMDAAGKDGAVKHVFSGVNPQGVKVTSFKAPCHEELEHDYLWRVFKALPERGKIGVFNRSYYEDVLVVQVHDMQRSYNMAPRNINQPSKDFFEQRYRQINNFERYLYENSYRVVKVFLNVSHEEQHVRFLSRIDDQKKNWKFSSGDLVESDVWNKYMKTFDQVFSHTATKDAPWYLLPADQKFVARYLLSELVKDVLKDIDPQYPELPREELEKMSGFRAQLVKEDPAAAKRSHELQEAQAAKKAEKKAAKKAAKAAKSSEKKNAGNNAEPQEDALVE